MVTDFAIGIKKSSNLSQMMVVVGDNELEKINVWPFLLFELRSERVKGSHDTKLRTCVTPKQAIFIFVRMRINNILLIGISFVLLAFVYWPTKEVHPKKSTLPKATILLKIPETDPHLYTAKLNNYLSDYIDRSVKQGIPAAENTSALREAFRQKKIVFIKPNAGFVLDTFEYSYAFLTPYASEVLQQIGAAFQDSLARTPLKDCQVIVTSMTRTKQTVAKLMRRNRTAVSKSPHLNGNTFDLSFSRFQATRALSQTERTYLQSKIAEILLQFKKELKIWVTFEPHEECLHIVARQGI